MGRLTESRDFKRDNKGSLEKVAISMQNFRESSDFNRKIKRKERF